MDKDGIPRFITKQGIADFGCIDTNNCRRFLIQEISELFTRVQSWESALSSLW